MAKKSEIYSIEEASKKAQKHIAGVAYKRGFDSIIISISGTKYSINSYDKSVTRILYKHQENDHNLTVDFLNKQFLSPHYIYLCRIFKVKPKVTKSKKFGHYIRCKE